MKTINIRMVDKMSVYNYYKDVYEDTYDAVNEIVSYAIDNNEFNEKYSDFDDMYDQLYDELFVADRVTGNASGSYTFNSYKAEMNLAGNYDLLSEAAGEFGETAGQVIDRIGTEGADVTIRCYLLSSALKEVLDDLDDKYDWDELFSDEDEEE